MCFFALKPSDIYDSDKRISLSANEILLFNPNTRTLPIVRTQNDLILLRKIYENTRPLVIKEGVRGNPWGVKYLTMFHMSADSKLFQTNKSISNAPLYEAKMFWHFDHRWANSAESGEDHISSTSKIDSNLEPKSRFYIEKENIDAKLNSRAWAKDWLIVHRNVSDSRNERTFVAAAIPRCGVGHSATVLTVDHVDKICCFLGTLDSLVFDYAIRQKVPAMNISAFMVDQFPTLEPEIFIADSVAFITPRVLELTYTSHSMASFARDLGYGGLPYRWDEDRRALLRAELDAWYARAYGLTRDELRYILDPADVKGPDYPSETFRVLKTNEIARFNEYRTAKLVLQAWDRLASGELN